MTGIFIKILEMSATGSVVIGVIILLRFALKKAPKIFSYVLWAAALFRLLCPVSFELPSAPVPTIEIPYSSDISAGNAEGLFITGAVSENTAPSEAPAIQTEYSGQAQDIGEYEPVKTAKAPVKKQVNLITIASYIWALAVMVMISRGVISWAKLSRTLRSAQKAGENVYVSAAISDPFIMGVIRPKIYLPAGLNCTESGLIIRHEKAHMHRGDHIAKLVMYLTLCIHCFNPLVWVMFRLFERDMEMSCDERVTADMTNEQKADYSQTLLKISSKPAAVFTASFGESSTKQRVKNVLSFKKPGVWVIILLTVLAVAVSVVLCANRKKDNTATVPNVYSFDYETAYTMLQNKGFSPIQIPYSSTEPEGTVVKTKPPKNKKAAYGSKVILFISDGDGSYIPGYGDDPDLISALGVNGITGKMRIEDYYGVYNDKYEKHTETITDEDEIAFQREKYYSQYGDAINGFSFTREYILIPLYDDKGEKVVDHFKLGDITPVPPEDYKFSDWKNSIKLIPLTEERQKSLDMSTLSPEMLYADKRNCLFTDGAGGLYLYNFENKELLLAVDFLASAELANSDISDEAKQYGGALIYSSSTGGKDKNIYFAFETKGKEKRGGEFDGQYYYLDAINSELQLIGASNKTAELAVTKQTDPDAQPDAISSLLAMMNGRDYVYIVNSGLDDGHLPMIRLARNINGNVDYFDPFENGLIPKENAAPEEWGLSFTAENAAADGVRIKLSRNGSEELVTGSYFIIQKKDIYGWSEPAHCIDYYLSGYNAAWTDEALIIPDDGEREIYEDWSNIYGQLDHGSYRIGKYFSKNNGSDILIFAYFNI